MENRKRDHRFCKEGAEKEPSFTTVRGDRHSGFSARNGVTQDASLSSRKPLSLAAVVTGCPPPPPPKAKRGVAIKSIRKEKIKDEQDMVHIRREIEIMSSLRHPHIISIYEGVGAENADGAQACVCESGDQASELQPGLICCLPRQGCGAVRLAGHANTDDHMAVNGPCKHARPHGVFENKDKIVIVMEYASKGELYDYISERRRLSERETRHFFRQIVSAVHHCHKTPNEVPHSAWRQYPDTQRSATLELVPDTQRSATLGLVPARSGNLLHKTRLKRSLEAKQIPLIGHRATLLLKSPTPGSTPCPSGPGWGVGGARPLSAHLERQGDVTSPQLGEPVALATADHGAGRITDGRRQGSKRERAQGKERERKRDQEDRGGRERAQGKERERKRDQEDRGGRERAQGKERERKRDREDRGGRERERRERRGRERGIGKIEEEERESAGKGEGEKEGSGR
ncbi:hypothetical protein JZ751_025941 [Albula glossodonta]|uniref:non-specific serine/threonine protein kinase n=1 Tax=Albula glossodonta TaxID=121402 RepID=A0A8T2MQD9_9TELE|nr:hypothetical protein JZ751_025941 [Albula glossodonta]